MVKFVSGECLYKQQKRHAPQTVVLLKLKDNIVNPLERLNGYYLLLTLNILFKKIMQAY